MQMISLPSLTLNLMMNRRLPRQNRRLRLNRRRCRNRNQRRNPSRFRNRNQAYNRKWHRLRHCRPRLNQSRKKKRLNRAGRQY